jgi:hypothetical protein
MTPTVVLLALALPGRAAADAPAAGPPIEAVEHMLGVTAVDPVFSTVRGARSAYLTCWHPAVVVEAESRYDDTGILRVTGLSIRLRTKEDRFLPLRRRP